MKKISVTKPASTGGSDAIGLAGDGLCRIVLYEQINKFRCAVAFLRSNRGARFTHTAFDRFERRFPLCPAVEAFVGNESLPSGLLQSVIEEVSRNAITQRTFAVDPDDGAIPDRIVHGKAKNPAEQLVVVVLIHQLPLTAHGKQNSQQQGTQQSFQGGEGTRSSSLTWLMMPLCRVPMPRIQFS